MRLGLALTSFCSIVCISPAQATEGGGGAYPNGIETLASATIPPPGTYLIGYTNFYDADRLNDGAGDSLVPDFDIDAASQSLRFVHVTRTKILGATWAMHAIATGATLDVHAAGAHQSKTGLADLVVDPLILSWTKGPYQLTTGLDVIVPIGTYRAGDLANIGRNYWTFEPIVAVSRFDPAGGLEASAKMMVDFNTRNTATDYKSGTEFHADLALGYNFNPIAIAATGYVYKQLGDDTQNGAKVGTDGYRGSAFAVGPMIRYQLGHVPVFAQWQHEFHTENRPQGDKFWLRANVRF